MEIRLADSITHKGFQTERKLQNIDLRNLIKQCKTNGFYAVVVSGAV